VLLNAIVLDDTETGLAREKRIQFSLDNEGRGGLSYVNPAARALAARPGFPPRKALPIAC
jgi:hypothetical protein